MKELGLQTIAVAEIDAAGRLRSVDDGYASFLAENIQQVGRLRQPVEVCIVKKGGYRLVAGGHRLAAVRKLGWTEVQAFVFEMTTAEAELAEVDENLIRHDLNPLDRAVFLSKRKALYESLHPETKNGANGGKGGKTNENDTMSFSKDTAERVGLDPRTIQRAVFIATRLHGAVKAKIAGTWLSKNQSELLTLAKLPQDEQRAVVTELMAEAPRAKSVSSAHRLIMGGQAEEADPDDAAYGKLISLWGRSGAKARKAFLAELKKRGDLTKFGAARRKAASDDGDE